MCITPCWTGLDKVWSVARENLVLAAIREMYEAFLPWASHSAAYVNLPQVKYLCT